MLEYIFKTYVTFSLSVDLEAVQCNVSSRKQNIDCFQALDQS